jgi:hypothetical protein
VNRVFKTCKSIALQENVISLWSWRRIELKFPEYKVEEDEVGGTCGTNGKEEERVYVIGRKARGKETTRKTET